MKEALQDIAKLASVYFEFPIAAVAVCSGAGPQFEVVVGSSGEGSFDAMSFGVAALDTNEELFIVKDASRDPRFWGTGGQAPEYRFFASGVLRGEKETPEGLICLLDRRPRPFSEDQERMLSLFARQAAVHLALDRTTQKLEATANQLRLSTERLERTQRLTEVGTWEFDFGSSLITWSLEMFEIYAIEPAQGVPKYEDLLRLHSKDSQERLHQSVVAAIRQGGMYEIELEIATAEGVRRIKAKGETILDAGGLPRMLVGTVQRVA